jgi:hypothetical protein
MEKYPAIRVISPNDSPEKNLETDPNYQEPEVEDLCEDTEVKEIIENAGLDYHKIITMRSVSHTPQEPSCIHCTLLEKVKDLNQALENLRRDVHDTEKTIKIKKSHNKKIQNILEKIEKPSHFRTASSTVLESNSKSCSCGQSCLLF